MNMNKILSTMTAMMAVLVLPQCPTRAQDTSRNFVKTVTMLDADGTDSLQAVQYYNGLGWPTLSVATVGSDGGTACTMTTYDALGREKRRYVPVPGSGLGYMAESDILSAGHTFHDDYGCFTQSHYDALDRATAVDMAGDAWIQAGRREMTEYLANTSSDMVLHYEAPVDGSYSLTFPENTSFQYYPEGSLVKTVSYDADSVCVTIFTNLLGKKVLERTAAGDTYYVYNDLGQLRFVLTPAFEKISRSKTMFAYEYRYDNRGRVVKKILPKDGTEGSVTQYWYDKADRVAYMRDPALGSRYRFYLYDRLGRLCVQGTCSGGNQSDTIFSVTSYASGSQGICQTGYAAQYTISDPQIEIVNYYDCYGFIAHHLTSAMPTINIDTNLEQYATGSLTGRVVYATDGEGLGTVNVYDQKGQVVRCVGKRLGGLVEDVRTAYSFTGVVDTVQVDVNVGYGSSLVANTVYTYSKGKKTKMKLSVSHGRPTQSRETEYTYDAVGRLSGKGRQLTGTGRSSCSYSYDVHGWLTSVTNGEFQERLYYADGLDGGCYNGNISTMKWTSAGDGGAYQGYNLKYDNVNRLYSAVYGQGDNLANYGNYFNEHVDYDCNGNITRLQRRGLVDNLHGGFGLVDNLYMTYEGNMLTSVRDSASHLPYASATDFDGVPGQEYPLTYDGAGSLVSDAGRGIAHIGYDRLNNPVRIQFTDGSVTRYIYSAAGEKLRVIHQTAVPNITVPIGGVRELSPSEILSADSTDYLLGGSLTLRNGRIDKLQFEEGYCQAEKYTYNADKDNITFYYYDRDHLGNVRQVTTATGTNKGTVVQRMDYYPFGAQLCGGTYDSNFQSHKYNGKEFDKMHGLNTYDYGARQYNPILGRWDRMDPLCEKYYSVSPYAYCGNNPVMMVDPDGRDWVGTYNDGSISWSWNDDITSLESAQMAGYSNYLAPGSIIDNSTIPGVSTIDGMTSVYLGYSATDVCYTWPNSTVTPIQVGLEWLLGIGPRHRDFTNGDYFTEMLRQHDHIQETKASIIGYILSGGTKMEGDASYDLGGIEGVGLYLKDYSTIFTGGATGNLAVTYLGSYTLKWNVSDLSSESMNITFSVYNSSTLQSATRPPVIGYTDFWKNTIGACLNNIFKTGPASKTSQSFKWTEKVYF